MTLIRKIAMIKKYSPTKEDVNKFLNLIQQRIEKSKSSLKPQKHEPRL
jgi:hypothetical protein